MMRKIFFISIYFISFVSGQTFVQRVWEHGAPNAIVHPTYSEDTIFTETGIRLIQNVSDPQLFVYLPPKEKASGTAIVICPGGGYGVLAIDHEGHDIAKWVSTLGIAGIVLKYRLPSDAIMKDKRIGPLQDVQEAIRITRHNSVRWNIDPMKVGVMGFSAGGHLAATASTLFDNSVCDGDGTSPRPDFSILLYPVISMDQKITHEGSRKNLLGEHPSSYDVSHFSAEKQVTEKTPPAFIALSADDKAVSTKNSLQYFEALNKHSIPVEMHIYESGGHGYGFATGKNTESGWPLALTHWLQKHHYIR